jgi:glucose-1-phosphate thymidylyltransferase
MNDQGMSKPRPPVGFLPAAGRGVRFGASGYAKELFPLLFTSGSGDRILEPRPICELALREIRSAGAETCVVVISPEKEEVPKVLGDGSAFGLSLAYVIQPEPRGLPHAVRRARPWLGDADVVFAMPDTIVLPATALGQVHEARLEAGAQVGLGVFPADEPERLGPVEVDASGAVVRILDKPGHREVMTTWGVASWSAAFTDFCAEWNERGAADRPGEPSIGHVFEAARRAGLGVTACRFETGTYLDIGTPRGLRTALKALAERGVLEEVQATLGL